ncbi:MAG: nitrate reductase associated protein [Nodosilinea sp.]
MSSAPHFFEFEADFVDSLRCIPMQVRLNLDTCGIKLTLPHWHQLSSQERQQLARMPCDHATAAAYGAYVQALVARLQGSPASTLPVEQPPPWENPHVIPAEVQAQAVTVGCTVSINQWQALAPIQRFALIKLSRPGHENRNFEAALQEFGLVP